MQRGVKLALVSGVLSTGVAGALLFRHDATPGEVPPVSNSNEIAARGAEGAEGSTDEDSRTLSQSLLGRIELNDPPAESATSERATPSVASAVPRATELSPPDDELPAPTANRPAELPPLAREFPRPAPAAVASAWEGPVAAQVRLEEPVPVDTELPAPATGATRLVRHKVKDGDTLSGLARRYLGRGDRFVEIYEANRDRLPSPDLLPIGIELMIPVAKETMDGGGLVAVPAGGLRRPADGHVARTYRVRESDTLREIARRFYGDGERWTEIYSANRERLASPDDLRDGLELLLP